MPRTKKTEVKEAKVVEKAEKPVVMPVVTEKAYASEASRVYIFQIPRHFSKTAAAQAVEAEYGVSVISVRTMLRKGKPTRFSRGKRAYPGTTYRQDKKFAYVTLKEGDRIPLFDELKETATEAPKEAEKVEKKSEKAEKAKTAKGDK